MASLCCFLRQTVLRVNMVKLWTQESDGINFASSWGSWGEGKYAVEMCIQTLHSEVNCFALSKMGALR